MDVWIPELLNVRNATADRLQAARSIADFVDGAEGEEKRPLMQHFDRLFATFEQVPLDEREEPPIQHVVARVLGSLGAMLQDARPFLQWLTAKLAATGPHMCAIPPQPPRATLRARPGPRPCPAL